MSMAELGLLHISRVGRAFRVRFGVNRNLQGYLCWVENEKSMNEKARLAPGLQKQKVKEKA